MGYWTVSDGTGTSDIVHARESAVEDEQAQSPERHNQEYVGKITSDVNFKPL